MSMHVVPNPNRLGRGAISRVTGQGLALVLLLCAPPSAVAHQTSLNGSVIPIAGAPATITVPGSFQFSPNQGGWIRVKLRNVVDPLTGKAITSNGNRISVDVVINGTPQALAVTFPLKSGSAAVSFPGLNLVAPDLVEVHGAVVKNASGVAFGRLGLVHPGVHFSSAIIQVQGTPSAITLAPTRDADTLITATKGGVFSLHLDSITPADAPGNRVELEIAVNGGAPELITRTFDIVDGYASVSEPLGLVNGDVVEVRRIDVYDSNNERFATLGVRIMNP